MAYKHYVLVCGGTGCESSKADDIFTNLKTEVANAGLEHDGARRSSCKNRLFRFL